MITTMIKREKNVVIFQFNKPLNYQRGPLNHAHRCLGSDPMASHGITWVPKPLLVDD